MWIFCFSSGPCQPFSRASVADQRPGRCGVPAFLLLIAMLTKLVWVLLKEARRSRGTELYSLPLAMAIMVIGFAVRNIFDYMFAGSLAILFWILVAAGLSRVRNEGAAAGAAAPGGGSNRLPLRIDSLK